MAETNENTNKSHRPREHRCKVSDQTFILPAWLVREVGFKSQLIDPCQSAKVAWYYHDKQNKAVLANNTIERSSLEVVGSSALYGVSNDDLESGDVSSARVTIIKDLPEPLYKQLVRDRIVLKPHYSTESSNLDATMVSVYPEKEYDTGELPNVTRERVRTDDPNSNEVIHEDFADMV